MPDTDLVLRDYHFTKYGVYGAIIVGLIVGTLISFITEFYTAMGKRPVYDALFVNPLRAMPLILLVGLP